MIGKRYPFPTATTSVEHASKEAFDRDPTRGRSPSTIQALGPLGACDCIIHGMSADSEVISNMRLWIEKAVIGLNLCPFARSVYVKEQIRYVISKAQSEEMLLEELRSELQHLQATPPQQTDTTLLIHPRVLENFQDFNQFLGEAERALAEGGWEGEFQIASFHPHYQFSGTDPEDITNYTNRAPYPCLHLLRESSVARAVSAYPNAQSIFEANIRTLQQLGHAGWKKLGLHQG